MSLGSGRRQRRIHREKTMAWSSWPGNRKIAAIIHSTDTAVFLTGETKSWLFCGFISQEQLRTVRWIHLIITLKNKRINKHVLLDSSLNKQGGRAGDGGAATRPQVLSQSGNGGPGHHGQSCPVLVLVVLLSSSSPCPWFVLIGKQQHGAGLFRAVLWQPPHCSSPEYRGPLIPCIPKSENPL